MIFETRTGVVCLESKCNQRVIATRALAFGRTGPGWIPGRDHGVDLLIEESSSNNFKHYLLKSAHSTVTFGILSKTTHFSLFL